MEKLWYGESPNPVGPIGRSCQYLCPAFFRKSANAYAAFPNVPIPYRDGSEEIAINTPLLRSVIQIAFFCCVAESI